LIRQAVDAAIEVIVRKEGVIIHCMGGRGRTGTVIGCILRRLGCGASRIISYLDALNRERARRPGTSECWPESPWQSELVNRFC
jgi:protein-tyrosine phosphatase